MTKKLDLIFKPQANIEILEAFNYYEDELEGLGERFLNELDKVILSVNLIPNGFKKFHIYRQIPFDVFPYILIYEVIEKYLVVYAVFKTAQDPQKKIR
jgi:hypothetical protein